MARDGVNGLGRDVGVHKHDVDALLAEDELQSRRQTARSSRPIGERLIDFHVKVDVPAAGAVIHARAEQAHASAWPEEAGGLFDDGTALCVGQAHGRLVIGP